MLTGPAFAEHQRVSVTGPLAVTIDHEDVVGPVPLLPGPGPDRLRRRALDAERPDGGTSNPVGTGPFVFQDWVPNSHMTATGNPHYWRKGYPYLDSITYKPIINADARVDALETGEIDIMHTNAPDNLLQFRGDKKWSYYDNSGQVLGQPTVQCVMLNTAAAPFNNHTLRLAMAKCINRPQYAKVIDKGINAPMNGLFLPGSAYYTRPPTPPTTPRARPSWSSRSAADGQASRPSPSTPPATRSPGGGQFLQQAWEQAGMKVNVTIMAQATIINDALAGTYQATLWRQFGAVDPDLNYVWWSTQTVGPPLPLNMARNIDPRIQTALMAGRTTSDKADRIKSYQQINQYLAEDIPYLWLARDTWAVIANPKVQNFANPTTLHGSKAIGFDEGVLWPTQIWVS